MSFNMSNINSNLTGSLSQMGADIQASLPQSGDLSETELLKMQHSLGKWSIMVNLQSNIQKSWAEALKAVVQNVR